MHSIQPVHNRVDNFDIILPHICFSRKVESTEVFPGHPFLKDKQLRCL